MIIKSARLWSVLSVAMLFVAGNCSKKNDNPTAPPITPTTGSIAGKVVNSATGLALYGVSITTSPATSALLTDSAGGYIIPEVEAGNYIVSAAKTGYNNCVVNIVVKAQLTTTADIAMVAVTPGNNAPIAPSIPSPSDGATSQPTSLTLAWSCTDPDSGDVLHYDVYFGTANPPTTVAASNINTASLPRTGLDSNLTFYWRILARDNHGATTMGPVWHFTTVAGSGTAPNPPALSSPADGATGVSTSPMLSWNISSGATSYALQVSLSNTFSTFVYNQSGITAISQPVTGLSNNTLYYWRVSASNGSGTSAWSNVWSFTTAAGGSPAWATMVNMPTARNGLSTTTANGKIYAIGGRNGSFGVATVEEYDPINNTWSTKADMPAARYFHASAEANGKIYAIGGGFGVYNTVFEYDPIANTWKTMAAMPTARQSHVTVTVNGKIYAIGGSNSKGNLNTVEEYDPKTNTWATKATMPTPRMAMGAAQAGDKIYVIGGCNESYVSYTTVEIYDPASNTWTTGAPLPVASVRFATEVVNGKVFIFGGWGTNNVTRMYDPALNTWTTKTSMPTARGDLAAAMVAGNIYVIGGKDEASSAVINKNERYTPGNDPK